MKEISISELRENCSMVIERVRKTKQPIRITRRGVPVAEVVPSSPVQDRSAWIESMKGSMKILGDIVSPAGEHGW